jgi:hypothetical protein
MSDVFRFLAASRSVGRWGAALTFVVSVGGCGGADGEETGSMWVDGGAEHVASASAPFLRGAVSISRDYVAPASIQGVGDFYWHYSGTPGDTVFEGRIAELGRRGADAIGYSVRWSDIDREDERGTFACTIVNEAGHDYCFDGALLNRLEQTLRVKRRTDSRPRSRSSRRLGRTRTKHVVTPRVS